jgi:ubiquinone/menaquinone biosynthesis C-methylase UbiE
MSWFPTPARRNDPELMDEPGLPEADVAAAYATLERVNRALGNRGTLRRAVRRFAADLPAGHRPVVLDVGAGGGDLADEAARVLAANGAQPLVIVLDRDPTALGIAGRASLTRLRGDALRVPLPDRSIDLAMAIKFAHHFEGDALRCLMAELARVARRRVVVLDIQRHWLAYAGFVAWSRVFTRSHLVRHDGPLSVLRGFTPDELRAAVAGLDAFEWSVRVVPPFQLVLTGVRREGA